LSQQNESEKKYIIFQCAVFCQGLSTVNCIFGKSFLNSKLKYNFSDKLPLLQSPLLRQTWTKLKLN